GSGQDETVSAVAADKIAIDGELQLNHASQSAFVDDRIIQHVLTIEYVSLAEEFHLKHDALAHGGASRKSFLESGVEFFHCEAGEEAEAAHVDGENWNATRCGHARGCEEGAVSSENQENLRLVRKLFPGEGFGRIGERGGSFFVVEHAQAARFQPAQKLWHDSGEI